jgi:hypothetical protein
MAKKRILVIFILIIFLGFFGWLIKDKINLPSGSQNVTQENPLPTPTTTITLTKYSNQEFGFSLAYPNERSLPKETKITPPQQHLYQIIFNPGGEEYFIDIYRQMMPLPLTNFVRNYFTEASWSEEQKINEQNVVRFFLPKSGLEPTGSAGIAFAKDNNVLVISTSNLKGEKEKIINNSVLNQLAESFVWGK